MLIRFKVAYNERFPAGSETDELPNAIALRCVRSGIAEHIGGDEGLNKARAKVGMEPLPEGPSMAMTKVELLEMADDLGVEYETDDNKADLIRKI